ncbi:autotransporter outer membrane beta-barrel domain-containing protein, partial [Parendozoicomonas sp. Alg238-R29]|uniref:autotransporter family protein n=1 Tax=Parendozoicomonas sp. Alg238-R29 TaxID=2993446 RepID=UPI00248DF356
MDTRKFLKSALALAISSAPFHTVQGNGDVVVASNQPVVITQSGAVNRDALSANSGDATVILDKVEAGFFSGIGLGVGSCNSRELVCSYKNRGTILAGNATYALEVKEGAWYRVENLGSIRNLAGDTINIDSDAGNFTINNRGDLISSGLHRVINHQANTLFTLTSSGTVIGNIDISVDSDIDTLSFSDGSYAGIITGAEQVNVANGLGAKVDMNGTVNLSGSGSDKYFTVSDEAVLQTSGLIVNGAPATFQSGTQLVLELDSATPGSSIVTSNNTITVAGTVVVIPDASHTGSVSYTLLQDSAGIGGSNPTLEVMDLYTVTKTSTSGNQLVATVELIDGKDPGDVPGAGGANQNERQAYANGFGAAGTALQGSGFTREQGEKFRDNFFRQYTPETAARLASELLPTLNRSSVEAGLNVVTISNKAMVSRMDSKIGVSTGDEIKRHSFWMQGLHNEAHQDDRRHQSSMIRGYHSRLNGFTMGLDADVMEKGIIGFAASYANSDINKNDVADESSIDSYLATLYGRWQVAEALSLDVLLNYGINKNERKRVFDIVGSDLNPAESEFDSKQVGIKAILQHSMDVGDWILSPMLGYHYSHFTVDAYREKGSVAALSTKKQTYKINELGVGAGISRVFNSQYGYLTPEVKVMGWHDFSADPVTVNSRFVVGGDSFVFEGVTPEKTNWNATAGVTWSRDDRFDFSAGYERNWRSGYH